MDLRESRNKTANYLSGIGAIVDRRFSEAVRILANEPAESPCYVLALGNLALAYNNLTKHEDAERYARTALAEIDRRGCPDPGSHVQFWRNLAEATLSQGRPAEALTYCDSGCRLADELIAKCPELATEIAIQKAHTLCTAGWALLNEDPNRARERFDAARRIYREQKFDGIGYAECLTNLSHTLRLVGQPTEAELALKEAMDSAQRNRNEDQLWRIVMALAKLGSNLVPPDRVLQMSRDGADAAMAEGRVGTAYVRYGTGAQILHEQGRPEEALSLIAEARRLEENLDLKSLDPAILRFTEAELCEELGRSDAAFNALLDGAYLWFDKLRDPDAAQDLRGRAQKLHDHFRLLSRNLLRADRSEESFVSFEAGRGLAHSLLVDPRSFVRITRASPFDPKKGKVSLDLLSAAQSNLGPEDVLVSLAIIPPYPFGEARGYHWNDPCAAVSAGTRGS